jgi:ABC-2 type transport system ATP-binding protein
MEEVLEAERLTKIFNGRVAVSGISFHLNRAEILGIVGPNGAGKTTTLHMLLGLTTATEGAVRIFGKDLERHREEILKRVNFSSSYVAMPHSLTVRENLLVFSRLYGVKEPAKKIEKLLAVFGMRDSMDEPCRRLSSGQLTRIGLAKALLNDPDILFLDEPTASLDPDIADRTRTLLKTIRDEKGLSILYTSHNMKEMEELCDRVIFLSSGRIIAEGRPTAILKEFSGASLEEVFLKIARQG